MGQYWDEEEDKILKNLICKGYSAKQVVEEVTELQLLKRTESSILTRLVKLGLSNKIWSSEEDELLINKAKEGLTFKEISNYLPLRSHLSVKSRAKFLKIKSSSVNYWTKKEDEILQKYYGIIPLPQIINLYLPNRTILGAKDRASSLGLKADPVKMQMVSREHLNFNGLWNSSEIDLLVRYYGTMTVVELAKLIPRHTYNSVVAKASDLGLKINLEHRRKSHRKYSINLNYFKELTLENCYWAGFIAADGNLNSLYDKNPSYRFQMSLHLQDEYHLESFANCVGYDGPVFRATANTTYKKDYTISRITINGVNEWYEHLNNHFNITPKKSLTLLPPNNLILIHKMAYLKGLIDGDGWINKMNVGVCGNIEIIEWCKDLFKELSPSFSQKTAAYLYYKKDSNLYSTNFSGKRAKEILSYLIQLPTPTLKRKWDKVKV